MINKTSQSLDNRLIQRLADTDRELRDIKTRQLVGLDSFIYRESSEAVFSFALGGFGGKSFKGLNFLASTGVIYASELGMTLYINNDNDPDYAWPYGSAISFPLEEWNVEIEGHYDPLASDLTATPGRKYYQMVITNNSPNTITFHLHARLIYPAFDLVD